MILALYLLKSTLVMSLLLVFYRCFLEKEKMHVFNRFFLLFAIVLSIIVPLLPTGIAFFSNEVQPASDTIFISETIISQSTIDAAETQFYNPIWMITFIYIVVSLFLSLRFGRNIFSIIKKISRNEIREFNGARLVLLDDCKSPFTFWNYIFLHKKTFEKNSVDQQLLDHELTHAKQKHSWDILFIEFVMLIFWFNPILRLYKTAIQLNHEFLADDSVIEKYNEVKTYQYLLLDTIKNNNKISLASNINFHLTQKRLKMMTKKSSSVRKKVLIFSLLPILLGVLIGFGNPVILQGQNESTVEEFQGDLTVDKDKYFKNAVVHYKTKDGMTKVITYKSLNDEMKAKIPLPPPPPPSPNGAKDNGKKMEPLPKGTVVYLNDNGRVRIGNNESEKMVPQPPFPPKPPMPPKPVKPGKASKASKPAKPAKPAKPVKPVKPIKGVSAPVPPEASITPEPPTPLPDFADLVEGEAEFYVNEKKVTKEKARKYWEDSHEGVKCINLKTEDNGKMSVHITKK